MKHVLLIASLTANALMFGFLAYRHLTFKNSTKVLTPAKKFNIDSMNLVGISKYDSLPVRKGDIVFVGTSETFGFPLELLTADKFKNRGVSGNVSRHILKRIDSLITGQPSKVFLEMGTNDILQDVSLTDFTKNYNEIIRKIKTESPKTIIYSTSIFPMSGIYGVPINIVKSYDSAIKNLSKSNGVEYIDLFPLFEMDGQMNPALSFDGVHLDKAGYKVWANAIDSIAN